jgi:hypothetical protein
VQQRGASVAASSVSLGRKFSRKRGKGSSGIHDEGCEGGLAFADAGTQPPKADERSLISAPSR